MALIMLILTTLLLKYSAQSRIIMTMPDSVIENVLSLTLCFIFCFILSPSALMAEGGCDCLICCFKYLVYFLSASDC